MDQDLKAYLDEQFGQVDKRFEGIDKRFDGVDKRLQGIDRRLDEHDQQFEQIHQQIHQHFGGLKDDVRRAYVLIEDLRDNVKLVGAEGVASVREQLTERQEEISKKLGEVETFNRDSYKDLRRSYDDLDSRVRRLESSR
jgi:archaellum component FlaC